MIESSWRPAALYVHFPFCAHRCHYCDFSVKRSGHPPIDEWLGCIDRELEWWFAEAGWTPPLRLDSVFVGGGTPSLLGVEGPERLGALLRSRFEISDETEWTAESNPASLTPAVAASWRRAGANRLSIGVQAFEDRPLQWLGRLHDAAGARRAVLVARDAGFDSVSVDLMFGLPRAVERSLEGDVETALELAVDHISAYGLTVEPRTPLARWVDLGRVEPIDEDAYAAEYRRLAAGFRDDGMIHYEVSNFARAGHECRHNWYYWNRSPYLGVGPSAHGFLPPFRVWNTFRWDRYSAVLRDGGGPVEGFEELSDGDGVLERLWLGLRTREGLDAACPDWSGELERRLPEWLDAGWIREDGGWVTSTVEGWLRLDELVAELGRAATRAKKADRNEIEHERWMSE